MKADFHLHTTASDGSLTPSQVVEWAKRTGLEVIAITDHEDSERPTCSNTVSSRRN